MESILQERLELAAADALLRSAAGWVASRNGSRYSHRDLPADAQPRPDSQWDWPAPILIEARELIESLCK